jgi:hypothetical protein
LQRVSVNKTLCNNGVTKVRLFNLFRSDILKN